MRKEMNKKGIELATSTIILIVLAILVLIALLFLWNQQTSIFSNFLNNMFGRTNVDSIVASCNTLSSENSVFEFCCTKKDVKLQNETLNLSCSELADQVFIGGRINKINCNVNC